MKNLNHEAVASELPDWTREYKKAFAWDPSRALLASIRNYQRLKSKRTISALILSKVFVLYHRFWSIVTGAEIPINTQIGGGLLIPHPNGIVIHPDVIIGPNCLIFQQVTIGATGSDGVPVIGTHVDIGAGAKILGNVVIEDYVKVGANAVVVKSVAHGKTVVGIPAKEVVK